MCDPTLWLFIDACACLGRLACNADSPGVPYPYVPVQANQLDNFVAWIVMLAAGKNRASITLSRRFRRFTSSPASLGGDQGAWRRIARFLSKPVPIIQGLLVIL
jgi:hypothetical protein